jgi:hypothetical protein
MSHPFFYMNPTFKVAYIRYEARPVNYDALYNEAFAQIGERTTITLSTERVSCQSGFLSFNKPIFEMRRLMEVAEAEVRAYNNFLHSALGFEPTDHSDAPPYIPTTPTSNPQPCIDFGFEPTEASE